MYYSDFYSGIDNMSEIVTLRLPYYLQSGTMQVKIYAIDSYGNISEPYNATITV